jgi:hypothetical protein
MTRLRRATFAQGYGSPGASDLRQSYDVTSRRGRQMANREMGSKYAAAELFEEMLRNFSGFDRINAKEACMNVRPRAALSLASCIPAAALLMAGHVTAASNAKDAHVTRIIRDVRLLPSQSAPKPAALNDQVREGTGVRTGEESRSELTFADLTITRLGANSIFSFNEAGRSVELGSGSLLLRVPKNSGGARISASAVTVGVTGTTIILESSRRNKLIVLEGAARISLKKAPLVSAAVRGGQMIDIPPGATSLPPVVNINVSDVMNNHPLIRDFPPLPTLDAIYANNPNPPPPVQGQPVSGGGSGGGVTVNLPVVGTLVGPVPFRPDVRRNHPSTPVGESSTHDGTRGERGTRDGHKKGKGTNDGVKGTTDGGGSYTSKPSVNTYDGAQALSSQPKARPSATPPPRRKKGKKG